MVPITYQLVVICWKYFYTKQTPITKFRCPNRKIDWNISHAKWIIFGENRGFSKTKGVRKHGVITVYHMYIEEVLAVVEIRPPRKNWYQSTCLSSVCRTSIGVLCEDSAVKPTMSEKNTVTLSKLSGATILPTFRSLAIVLEHSH